VSPDSPILARLVTQTSPVLVLATSPNGSRRTIATDCVITGAQGAVTALCACPAAPRGLGRVGQIWPQVVPCHEAMGQIQAQHYNDLIGHGRNRVEESHSQD
jgi:hypothetical protein